MGTNDHEGINSGRWLITGTHSGYLNTVGVLTIDATTFAPGVESGGPAAPNGPGLVVTNGTLSVVLAPTPATTTVQLNTAAGQTVLPASTVLLSGGPEAGSCTVLSVGQAPTDPSICPGGAPGTLSVDASGQGLSAADLPPGVYRVGVASDTGQFSQVAQQLLVSPGDPAGVALTLAANWSTQSGIVVDGSGTPQAGAQVSLHAGGDLANAALNVDQQPLQVTTGDDGRFTFEKVPDGAYTFATDKDGWAAVNGPTVTVSAVKNPMPADVTVTVTARDTRTVVVGLDSAARTPTARPINLAGAQVSLKPVAGSQPSGTPENAPLTGLAVTATRPGSPSPRTRCRPAAGRCRSTRSAGPRSCPCRRAVRRSAGRPRADPPPVQVQQSVDLTPATITVGWAAGSAGRPAGRPGERRPPARYPSR